MWANFHTAFPFLVAAARDTEGRPWATLLTGPEGFIGSPDPKSLRIDTRRVPGDALEGALIPGADLGLLGIELATRRRNRVNGRIGEAGQHLPIELKVPGRKAPVRRTYSLSNAPGSDHYRISVKREPLGVASRHLHDRVEVGAVVEARPPAGHFVLGCTSCPVALISAGVGLTPLLSMLHQLTEEGTERPVWWLHGTRDSAQHALAREVAALAGRHPNVKTRVAYSRPAPGDEPGSHYDVQGRVSPELVRDFVEAPDAHYYLCGPTRFMADVQAGLEADGVPPERIHTESFGPTG